MHILYVPHDSGFKFGTDFFISGVIIDLPDFGVENCAGLPHIVQDVSDTVDKIGETYTQNKTVKYHHELIDGGLALDGGDRDHSLSDIEKSVDIFVGNGVVHDPRDLDPVPHTPTLNLPVPDVVSIARNQVSHYRYIE